MKTPVLDFMRGPGGPRGQNMAAIHRPTWAGPPPVPTPIPLPPSLGLSPDGSTFGVPSYSGDGSIQGVAQQPVSPDGSWIGDIGAVDPQGVTIMPQYSSGPATQPTGFSLIDLLYQLHRPGEDSLLGGMGRAIA